MNLIQKMDKQSFVKYAKKYMKLNAEQLDKEINKLTYSALSIQTYELVHNLANQFNFACIEAIVDGKVNKPISHKSIPAYIKFFLKRQIDNHKHGNNFYKVIGKELAYELIDSTFASFYEHRNQNYARAVLTIQADLWMHWNIKAEERFGYSIFSKSNPCNVGIDSDRIVINFIDEEYEIPAKVALELLKQEYSVAMLVKKSNAYKKSPCKQSEQTK